MIQARLVSFVLVCPIEISKNPYRAIQSYVDKLVQAPGLEIVTTSLLPRGSGLGTSSILGGCVLSSLGNCIGRNPENLVSSVLALEQLLTTGGGWQDQIGGLYGGAKLAKSLRGKIPLDIRIKNIPLSKTFLGEMKRRMAVVFTGKPRLARGILQNVLRSWGRRSDDIIVTLQNLVKGAEESARSIENGDLDAMGKCMTEYWEQKKIMAAGSAEPDWV